jgi:hypothetical protein
MTSPWRASQRPAKTSRHPGRGIYLPRLRDVTAARFWIDMDLPGFQPCCHRILPSARQIADRLITLVRHHHTDQISAARQARQRERITSEAKPRARSCRSRTVPPHIRPAMSRVCRDASALSTVASDPGPPSREIAGLAGSFGYADGVLVNVQSDERSDNLAHGLPLTLHQCALARLCMWLDAPHGAQPTILEDLFSLPMSPRLGLTPSSQAILFREICCIVPCDGWLP